MGKVYNAFIINVCKARLFRHRKLQIIIQRIGEKCKVKEKGKHGHTLQLRCEICHELDEIFHKSLQRTRKWFSKKEICLKVKFCLQRGREEKYNHPYHFFLLPL